MKKQILFYQIMSDISNLNPVNTMDLVFEVTTHKIGLDPNTEIIKFEAATFSSLIESVLHLVEKLEWYDVAKVVVKRRWS